ncbi:transcriptional regulator LuxR [Legionella geestiana]|uniref:Transcriptional regulator LuxR n=1 Tax=Legionella geestiana TaxID=45065 RepID=A0A0W0TPI6_9GAMM|nr:helix-turn-helix transcriptional regulator [Legionella geestiana]KTC97511.1 transcriptional regulator LuxR [Legionella geestiana]QBS11851.1 helix-turn-helix transcriptional regulator [Legionella geestiana]QDQ40536.1 helix-turn-helix transcriptional regulator [Legionella geestiana]STX53453.1 transcriptional regulator LuxR [Legionella geestiana]
MTRDVGKLYAGYLIDHIPGYFSVLDLHSNFLYGNARSLQASGFQTLDNMQGHSYRDMKCKAAEQHETFCRQDSQVIHQQKPLRILGHYCYNNDSWRIIFGEKFILKDEHNQPTAIAQHFYDVTETNVFNLMMLYECESFPSKQSADFYHQKSYVIEDEYPELHLSERETECFFYLLRGHSAKSIANMLSLSVRTIEYYFENIKNKFNCYSKSELVEKAFSLGYLHIIPQKLLLRKTGLT